MTVQFKTTVKRLGALIEAHRSFLGQLASGRSASARRWLARSFSAKVSDKLLRDCIRRLDMPQPWVIEDIDIIGGGTSKNSGSYMAFTRLHVRDGGGKRREFHPTWRLEGQAWRSAWLPGKMGHPRLLRERAT